MNRGQPSPYEELASIIENLPLLLRETRRARGLSLRGAARQIGCGFTTVGRIERGEDMWASNLLMVVRWLGRKEET